MDDYKGQMTVAGYLPKRYWIRENANMVKYLGQYQVFKEIGFKLWEHPFVFSEVMKRPKGKILDIGMGHGSISWVLKEHGFQIVGIDNYESCWTQLKEEQEKTGIQCINGDARNLSMFGNNEFDIALLISVIEHIPSNTIWCEKRQKLKTGEMLHQEMPEKLKVIAEAVRVVKPGGVVVITSDIYLDFPPDMNISWREMLGIENIDRDVIHDWADLYIQDSPHHKGRTLSVGVIIEKHRKDAHTEILNRVLSN